MYINGHKELYARINMLVLCILFLRLPCSIDLKKNPKI